MSTTAQATAAEKAATASAVSGTEITKKKLSPLTNMEKLVKVLVALALVLGVGNTVLMFLNPTLYCKLAMLSPVQKVPVMCLQGVVQQILQTPNN